MRTMLLTLVLAATHSFAAGGGGPSTDADPKVSKFAVSNVSAIQALLQLSRQEHLPMGIIEDDDTLCKSMVSYSAENRPASTVVDGILTRVPAQAWKRSRDSAVFLVTPMSPRPVTTQFLQLLDPRL
jgi:hypothetical protein